MMSKYKGKSIQSKDTETLDELDPTRRNVAALLLGGAAAFGLSACVDNADEVAIAESALGGTAFQWVNTITGGTGTPQNLRSVIGNTSTAVVVVGGYSSIGDGGGGVFFWDPSSSAADNGGTIIAPTGGGTGRWRRLFSGPVNVRWFGAGLGAADDSAAIAAAINLALHNGAVWTGGTVYFPRGDYLIANPIYVGTTDSLVQWVSLRLTGDGKFSTNVYRTGTDSTCFIFGSAYIDPQLPGADTSKIRYCEISHMHLANTNVANTTSGAAIRIIRGGGLGLNIADLYISDVYNGIECRPRGPAGVAEYFNGGSINDVNMEFIKNVGLYADFALNWTVTNCLIGMLPQAISGSAGIWLDTRAEGWMFTGAGCGGGDFGLRMVSRYPIYPDHARPPDTHQFVQCNFDASRAACIYLTNSHRCRFQGCYASSTISTITGAIVLDNRDVYGFEWVDSVILNVWSYCFWIADASSFSIQNSWFATWGISTTSGIYDAITITGSQSQSDRHMSFIISGNTFYRDPDFPSANQLKPIRIQGYPAPWRYYLKYIVKDNLTYGSNMLASSDDGDASAKLWAAPL
jgi:hypothetical protein